MFEYLVRINEDNTDICVIMKLEKATFPSGKYEASRTFFDVIVKKKQNKLYLKRNRMIRNSEMTVEI